MDFSRVVIRAGMGPGGLRWEVVGVADKIVLHVFYEKVGCSVTSAMVWAKEQGFIIESVDMGAIIE